MIIVGLVLAGLAALLHVYIFVLESFLWTTRARAVFGTTADEAETTKLLALNQGYYNLFLALSAGIGVVLVATGMTVVGATLVFVGAGSMFLASVVLLVSDPRKARAAATQGTLPLLAIIALAVGLGLNA